MRLYTVGGDWLRPVRILKQRRLPIEIHTQV